MRMSCQFEAESVPVSYRMMFVSLIKQALKSASDEYYNAPTCQDNFLAFLS